VIAFFPEHVLDNSLHTAILLGVWIAWLFHERWGWSIAGLVVPGYLASMWIVAPESALVVCIEAFLTWALVHALGDVVLRVAGMPIFGRERFLLFIVASFPVRLFVSGEAMPALMERLIADGWSADAFGSGLTGIGVVLVPLLANAMWSEGAVRGGRHIATTTFLTWLVLTQVLIPYTNFGFGSLNRTFDSMATSAWTSPVTLILLITTAVIAARNNLRFGWDFGGILVPALLAILVYNPAKIAWTLAEIGILYALLDVVLRIPWLARKDWGGTRLLVLTYSISWLWKLALATFVDQMGWSLAVSDLFGFGYLLTSLVVVRCRRKGGLLKITPPILWTAGQGIAVSIPLIAVARTVLPEPVAPPTIDLPAAPVEEAVLALTSRVQQQVGPIGEPPVGLVEARRDPSLLVVPGPNGLCRVQRRDPVVFDCGGEGPVLVVPTPLRDKQAAWIAGWLLHRGGPSALIIPPEDPSLHPLEATWTGQHLERVLRDAHRLAAGRAVVAAFDAKNGESVLLPVSERDPVPTRRLFGVDGLLLDFRGAAIDLPVPEEVRPDAIVLLAPELVRDEPSDTPSDVQLLEVANVLVPSIRQSAMRGPVPVHLQWLAARLGASIQDDDGSWLLSIHQNGLQEQVRFRPDGEWVVAASAAWEHPGLPAVAEHAGEQLSAAVTWISHTQPGAREQVQGLDRAYDAYLRALMVPDTRGQVPQLLLMDRGSHGQNHPVLTVSGSPDDAGTLLSGALAPWPGAEVSRASGPIVARGSSFISRYVRAMRPEALTRLRLPPQVLDEAVPSGQALLAAWFGERSIRAVASEDVPLPTKPLTSDALRAFLASPSDTTLRDLRREGRVHWVPGDLRAQVLVSTDGTTCAGVVGAQTGRGPYHGCWEAP